MSCELFVRFREVGFHCWPEAPVHRDYLRARHRHVFHIEVRLPVQGGDGRELEYHDVLQVAREQWERMGAERDFGSHSCETLAQRMASVMGMWGKRSALCSVSEDGECGATAVYRYQSALDQFFGSSAQTQGSASEARNVHEGGDPTGFLEFQGPGRLREG